MVGADKKCPQIHKIHACSTVMHQYFMLESNCMLPSENQGAFMIALGCISYGADSGLQCFPDCNALRVCTV